MRNAFACRRRRYRNTALICSTRPPIFYSIFWRSARRLHSGYGAQIAPRQRIRGDAAHRRSRKGRQLWKVRWTRPDAGSSRPRRRCDQELVGCATKCDVPRPGISHRQNLPPPRRRCHDCSALRLSTLPAASSQTREPSLAGLFKYSFVRKSMARPTL